MASDPPARPLHVAARVLVAPELRNVDFNIPDDMPFALGGLLNAFESLIPRTPMPVLTAWGMLADRVYAWPSIDEATHHATYVNQDGASSSRPDRLSHVTLVAHRSPYRLSGPYTAMLEALPQLLPRYRWVASRVLALDLAGTTVLPPGEGGVRRLFDAAPRAAEPLLENVSGYRENVARLSAQGKATLRRVLVEDPARADAGALAAIIAAQHGAAELAEPVSQCILSPNPLLAGIAKVAAGKLGLGVLVTGQLAEVAPFLYPADVQALDAWQRT